MHNLKALGLLGAVSTAIEHCTTADQIRRAEHASSDFVTQQRTSIFIAWYEKRCPCLSVWPRGRLIAHTAQTIMRKLVTESLCLCRLFGKRRSDHSQAESEQVPLRGNEIL